MKLKNILVSASFAAATITAPLASAAAMVGVIGFGDGLETVNHGATDIVVGLTNIDMFNGPTQSTVGPCLGDFAALTCPTTGQATDFSFGVGDQLVFTAGQFEFHFTIVPIAAPTAVALTCTPLGPAQQCTDKWSFNGTGYVHDTTNTFSDTLVLISFALTGNCIDQDKNNECDHFWGGNYASTITATGQLRQAPEPGTLALVGLAIAAAGFGRRKTR